MKLLTTCLLFLYIAPTCSGNDNQDHFEAVERFGHDSGHQSSTPTYSKPMKFGDEDRSLSLDSEGRFENNGKEIESISGSSKSLTLDKGNYTHLGWLDDFERQLDSTSDSSKSSTLDKGNYTHLGWLDDYDRQLDSISDSSRSSTLDKEDHTHLGRLESYDTQLNSTSDLSKSLTLDKGDHIHLGRLEGYERQIDSTPDTPMDRLWGYDRDLGNSTFESPEPMILDGDEARPHTFPSMVSVQEIVDGRGEHRCGGTLASRDSVLTSASCAKPLHPLRTRVVLGAHKLSHSYTMQITYVAKIIIHPFYTNNRLWRYNDIAVLKLTCNVTLNPGFIEIQKYSKRSARALVGKIATHVGWGFWETRRLKMPGVLLQGTFQIIPFKECKKYSKGLVPLKSVCAKGRRATCFGDSGGPLVTKEKVQLAIASFVPMPATNCSVDRPSIFTPVGPFYSWLQDQL